VVVSGNGLNNVTPLSVFGALLVSARLATPRVGCIDTLAPRSGQVVTLTRVVFGLSAKVAQSSSYGGDAMMTQLKVRPIAVALILAAIPGSVGAQARLDTLVGYVRDGSGYAIPYVNVHIADGSRRVVTDTSGRFRVHNPVTPLRLRLTRIGFAPVDTTLEPIDSLVIVMQPLAAALDPVSVVARGLRSLEIHGFYDRLRDVERGINRGYFVTPEDIERAKASYTTRMLQGFPTVRVISKGLPTYDTVLGSNGCKMTVYMDNIRIVGTLSGNDELINQMVAPSHVAGIEIYPHAVSAPPRYQSLNGSCGVILIWTR
jgi:hypothetical protein